jgi:hypothetical protein
MLNVKPKLWDRDKFIKKNCKASFPTDPTLKVEIEKKKLNS